jgi:hypothetical protein
LLTLIMKSLGAVEGTGSLLLFTVAGKPWSGAAALAQPVNAAAILNWPSVSQTAITSSN